MASWIGLSPGNNESAGKRKSGHILKGSRWLKGILIQTGWAASRNKGTYLRSFYHRVAARRGKKRAIVAVAHKQSCIIYHELQQDKPYQEIGENFFDSLNKEALERRLVRRLETLGYRVGCSQSQARTSTRSNIGKAVGIMVAFKLRLDLDTQTDPVALKNNALSPLNREHPGEFFRTDWPPPTTFPYIIPIITPR